MLVSDGGTCWRSWLRHCATSQKVASSIPDGFTGIFHWHKSFRPHYGPGVDSASNRNEYQEYFLGVKVAGAYGWQPYHLHVPTVLKSGSLNLLESSGPVQACNGIAFTVSEGNSIPRNIRRDVEQLLWSSLQIYTITHFVFICCLTTLLQLFEWFEWTGKIKNRLRWMLFGCQLHQSTFVSFTPFLDEAKNRRATYSGKPFPLSRKQPACRQARWKIYFRTKRTTCLCIATRHPNKEETLSR